MNSKETVASRLCGTGPPNKRPDASPPLADGPWASGPRLVDGACPSTLMKPLLLVRRGIRHAI